MSSKSNLGTLTLQLRVAVIAARGYKGKRQLRDDLKVESPTPDSHENWNVSGAGCGFTWRTQDSVLKGQEFKGLERRKILNLNNLTSRLENSSSGRFSGIFQQQNRIEQMEWMCRTVMIILNSCRATCFDTHSDEITTMNNLHTRRSTDDSGDNYWKWKFSTSQLLFPERSGVKHGGIELAAPQGNFEPLYAYNAREVLAGTEEAGPRFKKAEPRGAQEGLPLSLLASRFSKFLRLERADPHQIRKRISPLHKLYRSVYRLKFKFICRI
ncbi:hypothetical protein GEV33_010016 [Tenebrio molitor]|uniref:Uncharacterized protein n=1 Tax=Tenebrio molitor TaxID=7067 RepID=A0A8J6HE45_TENMO|nr:hypothetical protein GEV33_010016 [Tenebrio molitor]